MLQLTSPSFDDGSTIPERFTKERGNVMPAFDWRGAPEGTESYVLIVEDPDTSKGTVRHLAVAEIGREVAGLEEGQSLGDFTVCRNVFGENAWGGPRPPAGHGPHHYHFKLMALDVPTLAVETGDDPRDLLRAIDGHVVDQAEIIGIYENKPRESAESGNAVRLDRFGGPDVLQIDQVATPQPKDDEVLVKVAAASVNPVDFKTREGKFAPITEDKLPITLGRDLAGMIVAQGARIRDKFATDAPVFAFIGNDRGAQSEYVIVKVHELASAPASIDLVHAAAVPLAAITAWQGLFDHGKLRTGQTVLIHGGAGGVGHLAIQLAKAKGAIVITTVGGDDLDFARELGADQAIDYKRERFEEIVRDVDVVFDLVGGETQDRSWQVIRKGGILVCTMQKPDYAKAEAHGVRAAPRYMAEPNSTQLNEVADLIDAGKVRVVVSKIFPFEEAGDAQRCLEAGHARGKIVVAVSDS
jgi:Raf kinase inhibitor-like YbhB/YbcL family protein